MLRKTVFLLLICLSSICYGVTYPLTNEPIDVVIPTVNKDLETLNLCIDGIRANCKQVRRIIVVSKTKFTDHAEWFDEGLFPFSIKDVAVALCQGNKKNAIKYMKGPHSRVGWYYQQLLKLYAAFVIPNISSNVLILDSDTIFLNEVTFLDENGGGLYNTSGEYAPPYFVHASKLVPNFAKVFPDHSGICHHMLFQRPVLEDLFNTVEKYHKNKFWKLFCKFVNPNDIKGNGASEYEIYFNFVFSKTQQVTLRPFKWENVHSYQELEKYKSAGYHYVTSHSCLRGGNIFIPKGVSK